VMLGFGIESDEKAHSGAEDDAKKGVRAIFEKAKMNTAFLSCKSQSSTIVVEFMADGRSCGILRWGESREEF